MTNKTLSPKKAIESDDPFFQELGISVLSEIDSDRPSMYYANKYHDYPEINRPSMYYANKYHDYPE
ncbi:MAG: hypothetical protein ABEK17_02130 [Candidatus Aenigmatarchaeota archaeon]